MTSSAPRAVLFDLDGTLIGTRALYLEAYRTAVEPYARSELTREDIMALRPTSELGFIRAVVAASEVDACLEDFYRAYETLHEGMFEGIYPGIVGLLDSLREAGVPLGIVTGKSRRSWDVTRQIISLGPFDVLVFDDDVPEPKPDPRGIELALGLLGVTPDQAVYVGDTMSDLRAAKAAGLRPITVLWSRSEDDRSELADQAREEGALAVVARPTELGRVLGLNG